MPFLANAGVFSGLLQEDLCRESELVFPVCLNVLAIQFLLNSISNEPSLLIESAMSQPEQKCIK